VEDHGLENHTKALYRQSMALVAKAARTTLARRSQYPQARPVLVVEDDSAVRAFLVAVLQRQGYRVIAAASGEEALQLLGEEPLVTGDPVGAYARAVGHTERFQVLPKPVAPELLEHAVAAAR
jgi:hypothetical protein